jgi:hypothetical protein
MARSTKRKADKEGGDKKQEAPITHGEVTAENPSGIEAVSEEHARHLGGLTGFGGPGAAGATVAGPVVHVATEGGTKPLPVANLPEDVETSGGGDASDQETSQAAALKSGEPENTGETQTPEQDQGAGESVTSGD